MRMLYPHSLGMLRAPYRYQAGGEVVDESGFGAFDPVPAQSGVPVASGGITNGSRALFGNDSDTVAAEEITPGGIGDAYKAVMASDDFAQSIPWPYGASDSEADGIPFGDQVAQADTPERFDACIEAAHTCLTRSTSPHIAELCRLAEPRCNALAAMQRRNPNGTVGQIVFPGGTIVEFPADGGLPCVVSR